MKTYTGGCHCKAVRFEVDIDLSGGVMECNCSICSKRGWLLAMAPKAAFRMKSGEDMLTEYQFNKKVIHHTFCKVCGTASFGRGKDAEGNDVFAVNVRTLDDVDVSSLLVHKYNGKDL